jgi:hypothetical protein
MQSLLGALDTGLQEAQLIVNGSLDQWPQRALARRNQL